MIEHDMLVNAVAGSSMKTWQICEEMERKGLADFTGNQHNQEWCWSKSGLRKLNAEQLKQLYEDINSD